MARFAGPRLFVAFLFALLAALTFSAGAGSQSQSSLAGKRHFLALLQPVSPELMQDPKTPPLLRQHLEYLQTQFAAGTLLLAGPRVDTVYGIVILETATREEAQRIVENDPMVRNALFRTELHEVRLPFRCGPPAPAARPGV